MHSYLKRFIILIGTLSMVLATSPLFAPPADADVPTVQATLERVTEMSAFYPPSPDPAGITYLADSNTLLICDSEVDEMPPYFTGVNLFEVTLSGRLIGTATTLPFSHEPTGIEFDSSSKNFYISDDNWQRVFTLNPGADGEYNTPDDVVTYFRTAAFGCTDPEDVAFDSRRGHLFVVDGAGTEVYDISPGTNSVFDGPPPSGDDVITHFDTAAIGITDPEGIAYNPDNSHLYILGSRGKIAETTIEGTLLRYINVYGLIRLGAGGGIACAPSSIDGTRKNLYIVARGIDNGQDPLENDGRLYEISFPPLDNDNSVPMITALAPSSTSAGGAAFTLTITGSNFVSGSVVRWNGADRTTTYVSPTQITAAIAAADISAAGTASVTVFSPAPGGGTSNAQTFTITAEDNPVPVTMGLSPSSTSAGGAAFTLTITGSNFVSGSVVRWNGADRTTTYVSPTQITAAIAAADISAAGTASVTVFSPAPGGGTSNAQTFTITAEDNPVPVSIPIASSKDDAEESYTGGINLTSTDLEMVYKSTGNQTVGLRFNGVNIPRGATIVNAFIQFSALGKDSTATALILQGENTGNAPAFASSVRNISSRSRTSSSVSWLPEAWTIKREAGPKQKSPDISSIIQEIVNRPDWSTNNSLAIIITGTGLRTAIPYDTDPNGAPKLSVEYIPSN